MRHHWIWATGLALSLTITTPAYADGIVGLWRFDIINSAGTTLGAMTVQSRASVQRQAAEQQRWAEAKGRGSEPVRAPAQTQAPGRPELAGYTGQVITDQGGHAMPIESIEIRDGTMVMVVNSPRGLVIFRGKLNEGETRFDGDLTYHNGSIFTMRGVKQVRLP